MTAIAADVIMPEMKTKVILEPDVARLLKDQARRSRRSFKEILNSAVRLGLSRMPERASRAEFVLDARPMQLKSGLDGGRLNGLLDELDAGTFTEADRKGAFR